MAFITSRAADRLRQRRAHGRCTRTTPGPQRLVCVSCMPDGAPPTVDVEGSQNGLFMTDDGRAFFSTRDALVDAGQQRLDRHLRVRREPAAADHHPAPATPTTRMATTAQPAWSASAPTAPTSTSRPSTPSSARTSTGPSQVLRRPHRRRLPVRADRRPAKRPTSAMARQLGAGAPAGTRNGAVAGQGRQRRGAKKKKKKRKKKQEEAPEARGSNEARRRRPR